MDDDNDMPFGHVFHVDGVFEHHNNMNFLGQDGHPIPINQELMRYRFAQILAERPLPVKKN